MRAAAVVALGTAATIAVAGAVGLPASDTAVLSLIAAGAAAIAGGVGALVLWMVRRWPIGNQTLIVGLTAVTAVALGSLAAARAMYLSDHDLRASLVILVAAGTVAAIVSLLLGRRVERATASVSAATRRIGSGNGATVDRPDTAELSSLAAELEAMAARLDEARATERALERSRRELVAWISHDLRTPLAGIRAVAEALEDGVVTDPETIARYHKTVREEADRLAGLVDDLFELSRIEAGALRLQLERASLADIVSDAVAAADPLASAKGVRLEGRASGVAPELVLSTPEVARVLRNLLENAIRHTPSDGTVSIETGATDDSAYVSVQDGCGGIPDDDIDRVFELAFRGEAARTPGAEADGGAGLGLAIAKGIVEAHDGAIDVVNDDGGCRFTVRLPLPGR